LGSPTTLPLPKDVVKPSAKKPSSKFTKKSTPSPPQRTKKSAKKKEASEQEPEHAEEIEPPRKRSPSKKREAFEQVPDEFEEVEEPKKKKLKKALTLAEKYAHFLQKSVVRGKLLRWNILRNRAWGCS